MGGERPLGTGSLDQLSKFVIHFDAGDQALAGMPEPVPDGTQRIELMVGPEEAFLELFRRHPFRAEHHVLPVVFRPIPIEDPAFAGIPVKQGGSRAGGVRTLK